MKKTVFLLLSCVFTFNNIIAQFDPNAKMPIDPNVRIGTLDNEMTYIIRKNSKPENKVEMRLAINVGSILEDDDQQGLAHFMEHMNFNGTKNFPDNELVDFLQSLGIKFVQHLNAYTSFDETVYMLAVPLDKPENLDKGLLVMEDWAFNAELTDEQIEKERGVVLEEMRIRLGPDRRMLDRYLPKLMNGSKYASRLPIGTKETIENFKPEVLRRFHKDWHRPDLMAIIIVGDINVDEIEEKIKTNFGQYKNPVNPRKREIFNIPNNIEPAVAVESDPDASFSRVNFYIKNKEDYTPNNSLASYFKNVVFKLTTSMINNRIQELVDSNNPPFTFGSVYYGGTWARSKEALQGFAITKAGEQSKGLEVLLEEVIRAQKYGFSESELERAKNEMMSYLEKAYNNRDKTDSERLAREYVAHFLEGEPIPGIEWEYKKAKMLIPMLPVQATNDVAKGLITDDNRAFIITGPDKEDITQPTEDEILTLVKNVSNSDIKPYKESEQIEQLIPKIPVGGTIVGESETKGLGTKTLILSNGVKVTYKVTDFKDDEILFEAISKGGSSLLNDADYNKTKWAFDMLNEAGINNYKKSQLTQYLSDKIADVSIGIGGSTETMRGNSSKKDLKTLFELIYSNFTNLNFDEAAYDAAIKKQNAFLSNILSRPQFFFSSEVQKFRNKDNPRFTGIIPDTKEWDATDFKAAYEIYKQKFSDADDFHFYFVGNIDETTFKEYIKTYIASLPSTKESENWKDTGYRPFYGDYEKVVHKGKDPKSMVSIKFSGETKYNAKEDLAMEALGKILTIKLIEQLREEEGGVYGVGASGGLRQFPYGSYNLTMRFPCDPENVDKLTTSALNELDKIVKNGPEEKDLNKYKKGELNDYRDNLKENKYWLSHLTDSYMDTDSAGSILTLEERINAITAKDIQDVAKKYAVKNKFIAKLYPEE